MSDLIESVHRANAELCAFQMRWDIDGDYIRCRKCKQPQLSTYANEAFMHAEKCRNYPVRDVHPWVTYLELLAPIAAHLNVAAWSTRHGTGDADHSPDAGKMGEDAARLRHILDRHLSLTPVEGGGWDIAEYSEHGIEAILFGHSDARVAIDRVMQYHGQTEDAASAGERG
jgi:hypothetical protein